MTSAAIGLVVFLITAILLRGILSAQWAYNKQLDRVNYACVGNNITIPWKLNLGATERIAEIEWFYSAGNSEGLVALWASNNFFPLPAWADRVEHVPVAGISLSRLTVQDSGHYAVNATLLEQDGGTFQFLRQSVQVEVRDELLTSDGRLHISENPTVVDNTSTNQGSIELRCGNFSYIGEPPFSVEWVNPDGRTLPSTGYLENHFSLLLDDPVKGGNYTCRIPTGFYDKACLADGDSQLAEASLLLDELQVKVKLLEAENRNLQKLVDSLTSQAGNSRRVAFHAAFVPALVSDSGRRALNDGDVFLFNDSPVNVGSGYNVVNGVFTAPYNGTYFFSAVIASWTVAGQSSADDSGQDGMAAGVGFCFHVDGYGSGKFQCTWSPAQVATMAIQPRLSQGNRVWVEAQSLNSSEVGYYAPVSSWDGFLVNAGV